MADDFPDTLTQQIGVLLRRETEARVLAPVIDALAEAFGRDRVVAIVRDVVVKLAQKQGASLAAEYGDDANAFAETLQFWTRGDAMEIEVLEHSETQLDYDVTRCGYADMYRALGIEELGKVLSCNRDFAMVEGFNTGTTLVRDETILGGAPRCTFRYRFPATHGKTD
ncbi:MAG: L-2-amino-thiazoline-4-carboxylic acid hydrolase [Rhodobacteraceae bacterium]|nr:L-2-amino-thiazoline-4-carboxylic acid hydrolase [Paracoccaceae bacterium]